MNTRKSLTVIAAVAALVLAGTRLSGAALLPVDNRPARADEWGRRPADGAAVPLNPPTFTWIAQANAATYGMQWATKSDFSDATTIDGIVWPTYTHDRTVAPDTYFWRFRYANATGAMSEWSKVTKVVVPAGAVAFPMPTVAQQRASVPQQHPRLFLRPEDLPRLRALAGGRETKAFAVLKKAADGFIAAGPTAEPTHRGSARDKEDAEAVKYWWPNRAQTEQACNEAETIAFVYLLTGDKQYGEAARRWVLHLAGWDPDGPTNFALNCEAGKVMLYRPARAYDWAWDMFTVEERVRIRAATQRRIADAWKSGEVGRGVGHLQRPFGSHANRVWHKLAETGIAFLDEIPEAPTWLDYAVNKFYACYPVWSDDDGGWHEGVSYWSGYMGKSVWWLQVAQSALGIDGLKKPFFAQVGDYPLYVCPPNSPNAGFGDMSFRPLTAPPFMEYHLRMRGASGTDSHAGYWRWWCDQKHMPATGGFLGFLYRANLPALPAAKPPTDLPPSKVFHGIGVASLHTTLLDSREDVHLLFKSSPFGSQSHGHNPQNSFQLNAYGEALLPACVYRDLHGSKFHYQWVHSTQAQNGVLVDGQGQVPHSVASTGRIVAERFGSDYDYVAGDALGAYGKRVHRAWRHAVLVKGAVPFVVIYDDLATPQPSTFQFMLHALAPFDIRPDEAALHVDQPKAGLDVRYLAGAPLAFRQWDGFKPAPSREFPNMWHVEASTAEKTARLGMVSVYVPHKAGARPTWTARRTDTAAGVEVAVEIAGQARVIVLPVPGRDGPVEVR